MNNKGIIFTLMTFLMIMAILALNTAIRESSRQSQEITEQSALASVGNRFRNIERMIIDLDKTGKAKELDERILPFDYTLDKDQNFLSIEQPLPLLDEEMEEFIDLVNMFEVFIEDQNRENVFDGITTSVDTIENSTWGGSSQQLNFLIEPFCYEYTVNDLNEALFRKSGSEKCLGAFQNSYIKRLDLNITINNPDEDYNSMLCNESTSCPQEAFNPAHPQGYPYYRIEINDSRCSGCILGQTIISQHFDPSADFNVMIRCAGDNCVSSPITIKHSALDFNISHGGSYRPEIIAKTTFSQNIEEFFFRDFNLTASHFDINASKSNRG